MRGYHQVSLIKPPFYSAAPCTPCSDTKAPPKRLPVADGEGVRVSLCSVSKGTQPLLFLLSAVCHVLLRFTDRHKCLSTPCSNAGGHSRSHQCQQQRQSLGTALVAHLLGICGLKLCDTQGFPSEHVVTFPDHSLLPWWPGMQLEPGKGAGKNFICQEPTGQVSVKNQ